LSQQLLHFWVTVCLLLRSTIRRHLYSYLSFTDVGCCDRERTCTDVASVRQDEAIASSCFWRR